MNRISRLDKYRIPFWIWLISVLELRMLNLEHYNSLSSLSGVAEGVYNGTPPWHAFQNRILGPYIVHYLSVLTHSHYDKSYNIFTTLIVISTNILLYYFMRKLGEQQKRAVIYLALNALLFVLVQDMAWLYIWDFLDFLFFSVMAYGIYKQWSAPKMILLFFFELLNREAALMISGWIILNSIKIENSNNKIQVSIHKIPNFIIGVFLSIFALAWTFYLRHTLFHHQMVGYHPENNQVLGNFFTLKDNLFEVFKYHFSTTPAFDFLSYWIIPVIIYYAWKYKSYYKEDDRQLVLALLLQCISIPLFASMRETRVYILLIPYIVFLIRSVIARLEVRYISIV